VSVAELVELSLRFQVVQSILYLFFSLCLERHSALHMGEFCIAMAARFRWACLHALVA
jgi:hypothetical protein